MTGARFLGIDLAWGEGSATKRAADTGVAALDGGGSVVAAGWTCGIVETLDWVEQNAAADALLFVDAPLVVDNERGQRLCERQTGQRYGRWKVSANTTNLGSPRLGGVALRDELETRGWRYSDGRGGPPVSGRVVSECYPYTTLVGVAELGYERERPRYKRPPKGMPAATWRPLRAAACDELIRRVAALLDADPPLDLRPHPETFRLLREPSPLDQRAYKRREDLLDAVISAWTAAFWSQHGHLRCQVLGVPPDGAPADVPLATIIAPARTEQIVAGVTNHLGNARSRAPVL
jgi:predicted RNase H-like nuclease